MSSVAAAVWDVVYTMFAVLGLTPDRGVRLAEQANFELNHTFFLNLLALAVAAVLLGLRRSRPKREQAGRSHGQSMKPDDGAGAEPGMEALALPVLAAVAGVLR